MICPHCGQETERVAAAELALLPVTKRHLAVTKPGTTPVVFDVLVDFVANTITSTHKNEVLVWGLNDEQSFKDYVGHDANYRIVNDEYKVA